MLTMMQIMAAIAIITIVKFAFDAQDPSKGHSNYWNSIDENGMAI